MRTATLMKLVAMLVAVVAAVGGASAHPHGAPTQEPGGGPEPGSAQDPAEQEPEELRFAPDEVFGQEGKQGRVGDTSMIINGIFEFTDSANDLFVWAWMPTISGEISDNALLGGLEVNIEAEADIGGDLFLFAQNSRIDGHVGGDVYAFVGDLTIAEGASVDGVIYGSGGALTINGEVGGPLKYAAGIITINARVRGDVNLEAGELELGPGAVIEGELRYESAREATVDPGAQVLGETRHFAPREDSEDDEGARAGSWFSIFGWLWDAWWLLSSFLVGAIALLVGGEAARRPAARLTEQPALGLGFGFVVAVVFPAASILAVILLATIPLGLIGMAVYLAAAYLARLVTAQTVGGWLLRRLRGGKPSSAYASLALGLVLFYLLTQIPYVGFLIWLAAVVAGLGGIFLATRGHHGSEPGAPHVAPAAI